MNNYGGDDEFLKMFTSKSDKQHYSATFELLVYTLFHQNGFSLSRHPQTKTQKKPDFLAQSETTLFYIECTLAGHSFESADEKNRIGTVEEIIDDIAYFPYWINVYFETISNQSISKKKLLRFIDKVKIASDGITNELLIDRKHLYEEDGWELDISLLRKSQPDIKRSLGFTMGKAKTIDTSKPLVTALNDKKAAQYGIDGDSYIICVNTNDLFTKENCFSKALFGQYGSDTIDITSHATNGFYISAGQPINTSVSAVIIFRNFDLFTLDNSSITVWHNPFAKKGLAINQLPFDEYLYDFKNGIGKRQTINKELDLLQVLGINKEEYISAKEKTDL